MDILSIMIKKLNDEQLAELVDEPKKHIRKYGVMLIEEYNYTAVEAMEMVELFFKEIGLAK